MGVSGNQSPGLRCTCNTGRSICHVGVESSLWAIPRPLKSAIGFNLKSMGIQASIIWVYGTVKAEFGHTVPDIPHRVLHAATWYTLGP